MFKYLFIYLFKCLFIYLFMQFNIDVNEGRLTNVGGPKDTHRLCAAAAAAAAAGPTRAGSFLSGFTASRSTFS